MTSIILGAMSQGSPKWAPFKKVARRTVPVKNGKGKSRNDIKRLNSTIESSSSSGGLEGETSTLETEKRTTKKEGDTLLTKKIIVDQ